MDRAERGALPLPPCHDLPKVMRIDFSAYADDYTVRGEVTLEGDRLADWLETAHDIDVTNLKVRALDDGREHHLPTAQIRREELCAVVATGPRGRADRRVRTRAYPMRIAIGTYSVVGYFQALPTADPWTMLQRRQIVALSPARIRFEMAGQPVEETHGALLLMRTKIDTFDEASDSDVGLSNSIDVPVTADARAKDMTADVQWPGRDR
jgi:hypothetical protein